MTQTKRDQFPKDFLWAASSAAYQIEGAWDKDGKGKSIWDIFSHIPGKTFKGSNGDIAVDHYNRYKEDVALMAEQGLKAYRFSISWTRIFPSGSGEVNQKGIEFYNNLIDELLKYDIVPIVTIYHWDLPQVLQDSYGGWESRQIIEDFRNYAKVLFESFSDRVRYWVTVNEQNVQMMQAYYLGIQPPSFVDPKRMYQANHHMSLANAAVIKDFREGDYPGIIGPSISYSTIYPASCHPQDNLAAENANNFLFDFWLDVYTEGHYPPKMVKYLTEMNIMPEIHKEDNELLKQGRPDFIGLNYYQSTTVTMNTGEIIIARENNNFSGEKGTRKSSGIPGMFKTVQNKNLSQTDWDWTIDPEGLRIALRKINNRYNLPILITENGIGTFDEKTQDEKIHDQTRIDYLKEHILAVQASLTDGVDVLGYCVWSFTDLLSWLNGYQKRYGFVYVDRTETDSKDVKRYKKDSYYWYKEVIASNGEILKDK